MKQVEVSSTIDADRETVEAALTPTSIVEYAGTYVVSDAVESGDGVVVSAVGEGIEIVLEFTPIEGGYRYTQRGRSGPFAEMTTWITVGRGTDPPVRVDTRERDDEPPGEGPGSDRTRVTVVSEFTFGGLLSFITDRLGAGYRRTELATLIAALAYDLEEDGGAAEAAPDGE